MSNDTDDDGMMTLIPAGTDLLFIPGGRVVTLYFPTEEDAIMFVELAKSVMGAREDA
jgi:hypothetical protein